jgi:hypothetical protein
MLQGEKDLGMKWSVHSIAFFSTEVMFIDICFGMMVKDVCK